MMNLVGIIVAACLALPAGLSPSLAAEQLSAEDILRALSPRVTRSLTLSPADAARRAEEKRFVNGLRDRPTRSLTTAEREQIATIAQDRPSVDLEVNFEYNSDTIGAIPAACLSGPFLVSRFCCVP
jgi:hypothetical protein